MPVPPAPHGPTHGPAHGAPDGGPLDDPLDNPLGDPLGELSHELSRHARLLHAIRAHMASWAPEGLDWSAFGLLMTLVKFGPARQGELAELALLDASTVSRYVAQLVRAGLVERRPDPVDGRAVRLAATAKGLDLARSAFRRREAFVREALAAWEADDLRTLAVLFHRLNDDLDAYRPRLAAPGAARPARDTDPTARTKRTVDQEN